MSHFNSLFQKISSWCDSSSHDPLKIKGVSPKLWPFFMREFCNRENSFLAQKNQLIVCPSIEVAEDLYEIFKKSALINLNPVIYPGLEVSPYGGILSSERALYQRFSVLEQLCDQSTKHIIITTYEALMLKMPSKAFFDKHRLTIELSDIIAPLDLAKKLVSLGYKSNTTVEEPGTFSQKGEIFDIYPLTGRPVRLHYFDDMVEEIFEIDLSSQKTNREASHERIHLAPIPHILVEDEYRTNLRGNILRPAPGEKNKFENRKDILAKLSDRVLFDNYPVYCSLFFNEHSTLLDYISGESPLVTIIDGFSVFQNSTELIENLRSEHFNEKEDSESDSVLPSPESIYSDDLGGLLANTKFLEINEVEITHDLDEKLDSQVNLNLETSKAYLSRFINPTQDKFTYLKASIELIKEQFQYNGDVLFSCRTSNSEQEIRYLIGESDYPADLLARVHFIDMKIDTGFYYQAENTLLLSDSDLFARKQSKTKKFVQKNVDLFAEQLATLKEGDYVIHNEHGMGIYQGLESMDVGGQCTDYLVILYAGNDKVYVPVYKMNLIQKHADSTAGLKPVNLRSNKFAGLKEKAKSSVKKLAFDLLKLQAERESSPAFAYSEPDHQYNEFELAFPFEETNDQTMAIHNVLKAMQKPVPMDHLVCGDVGFGKTEVAMRAAFKAVADGKQVAVLVPTTILALQHYNSFCSRFKDFAVNIEFISRFKTTTEVKKIKENLESGKVDILIGTHKLLGSTIRYQDLGLVIVDEEQRFGVGHKEKLKLLKSTVDFLTLTATPIPRTLQLAFLGLRDLSLIQTAPPRRQSIKTYLIKEDDNTLRSAIEKELSRGGQVFYVHNRVNDMDEFHAKLQELVPKAKIVVAHGQMSERELETKIKDFYAGKYQILLSTTIIESGIDIPNANTMIVDRADRYGLAQLHQLRGRIGRSDKKAYAYFVIPNNRNLTPTAEARLKALQTYADMGSGFAVASADLEIRGAGDILGGTQSGHIESIGLELYMELLKEAIYELRGEKKILKRDIEINTSFASYIPAHYIKDSSERLKYYKKLSNCQELLDLELLKEELADVYGIYPEELQNLFVLLETRIHLQHIGLTALASAGKMITLQFDRGLLDQKVELRNKVVETFMQNPKQYQFTPDYKVIYTHKGQVGQTELLTFAKNVAQQLVLC